MKKFNFNILLLFVSSFIFTPDAFTQENGKYEKRIHNYQEKWNKLIPRYAKIQYAGSMGLVSAGIGWNYGKKDQWETDMMFGYIPKYTTEHSNLSFTLKENFIPWHKHIGNKGFSLEPLTCGLYVNTIFDDDFWAQEPDKYPTPYYNFSTKIRLFVYLGQRILYEIPAEKRSRAKSFSFFYEISTSELYIITACNNPSSIKPTDYLHLSFGLRMQWF